MAKTGRKPDTATRNSTHCGTRPRTSWPARSSSCSRAPSSGSAPRPGRLLLRLRSPTPAHARRPREDRGEDAGGREARRALRAPRHGRARGAEVLRRAESGLQGRPDQEARREGRGRGQRRRGRERKVSVYQHNGFVDLCKGPHVETTGKIGPFKLLSIAGAYWRGNERNPSCSASMARCGPTRSSSTTTSSACRRSSAATTACSARSSSFPNRRGARVGTRTLAAEPLDRA